MEAKGFPNYLVSNHGKVFDRITREVVLPRGGTRGRLEVNLKNGYGQFLVVVARLVAGAFYEESIEGFEIGHVDGDPSNNALWNLEIVTREENRERAYALGLMRQPVKVLNLDTGETYSSLNEAGRKLGYLSAITLPKGTREKGDEFQSRGFRLRLV